MTAKFVVGLDRRHLAPLKAPCLFRAWPFAEFVHIEFRVAPLLRIGRKCQTHPDLALKELLLPETKFLQ